MNVREFRDKVNLESKLVIDGKEYEIDELVKFRFDDGDYYLKCYLKDGSVFADDDKENMYLLVRPVKLEAITQPFEDHVLFDNKEFSFLYNAHAVAEEIFGVDKHFKMGESEAFWDYMASDGSYLSLGINDQTRQRADFYGKIIPANQLKLN